jgi:hypothetical protein
MVHAVYTSPPISNRRKRSDDQFYQDVDNSFGDANHDDQNLQASASTGHTLHNQGGKMRLVSSPDPPLRKYLKGDASKKVENDDQMLLERRRVFYTPLDILNSDFLVSEPNYNHKTQSLELSRRASGTLMTPTSYKNTQSSLDTVPHISLPFSSNNVLHNFHLRNFHCNKRSLEEHATFPNNDEFQDILSNGYSSATRLSESLSQRRESLHDSLQKSLRSCRSVGPLLSSRTNHDVFPAVSIPPVPLNTLGRYVYNEPDMSSEGSSGAQVEKILDVGNLDKSEERFKSCHLKKWNDKLSQLREFKAVHGHCLVPHTYNEQLACWVKRQRRQYKLFKDGDARASISRERIDILNKEGFVWDSHEVVWSERFEEILKYKEQYGDCNVPCNFKENPHLGSWVKCQRRQYRDFIRGKRSSMTLDRIKKLESINFMWAQRRPKRSDLSKNLKK